MGRCGEDGEDERTAAKIEPDGRRKNKWVRCSLLLLGLKSTNENWVLGLGDAAPGREDRSSRGRRSRSMRVVGGVGVVN
jgi:hypothetical protein